MISNLIHKCSDCDTEMGIPSNNVAGELISCPACGLDYVIKIDENGNITLEELILDGEDWGE